MHDMKYLLVAQQSVSFPKCKSTTDEAKEENAKNKL